jgi:hypothetical protein
VNNSNTVLLCWWCEDVVHFFCNHGYSRTVPGG